MNNTKNPLVLPTELWKANTYLIVLPTPLDIASEYLAYAIALLLKNIQREVAFFIPMDYDKFAQKRLVKKLQELNLSIAGQLLTTNYTIAIDYQDGAVDSVSYDTRDSKFLLHVTPTPGKKFNFDSVSFSEGGGAFEQIIYCGSIEQASLICQKYPDLNKMKSHLVINPLADPVKSIQLNGKVFAKPMLEVITEFYKSIKNSKGKEMLQAITSNLLVAFLALKNMYHYKVMPKDLVLAINMLAHNGADMVKALDMVVDLPGKNEVLLYQKIFQNIQTDKKNNVIWSIVEHSDVQEKFVQSGNWLINRQLFVGLTIEVLLSWVIFLSKNKTYVVVSSNGHIDLTTLIDSGYKGTSTKGLWVIPEVLRESVLSKIFQVFSKQVPGLVSETVVAKEGMVLSSPLVSTSTSIKIPKNNANPDRQNQK